MLKEDLEAIVAGYVNEVNFDKAEAVHGLTPKDLARVASRKAEDADERFVEKHSLAKIRANTSRNSEERQKVLDAGVGASVRSSDALRNLANKAYRKDLDSEEKGEVFKAHTEFYNAQNDAINDIIARNRALKGNK